MIMTTLTKKAFGNAWGYASTLYIILIPDEGSDQGRKAKTDREFGLSEPSNKNKK